MKKLAIFCCAWVAIVGADKSSYAYPASAQLTLTTDSSVDLFITIFDGAVTASVPFSLAGTLDIQVEERLNLDLINDTTGLSFNGANIDLSDQTVDIMAGILGGILAEISGAKINSLSSNGFIPLTSTNVSNPFTYEFDPGGGSPTELSIDEGVFTYLGTGPFNPFLGSGTIDFATNPVSAVIPSVGQIGMVTQSAVVTDGNVYVTVSAPITFTDALLTDPTDVDAILSGVIVGTGYFYIPEPSSIVLLGIALVGLIPLWRRFHRQR